MSQDDGQKKNTLDEPKEAAKDSAVRLAELGPPAKAGQLSGDQKLAAKVAAAKLKKR